MHMLRNRISHNSGFLLKRWINLRALNSKILEERVRYSDSGMKNSCKREGDFQQF